MSELVIDLKGVGKRFNLVELERLLEGRPRDVFRHIEAVSDVSLRIDGGQVYGFLGPNGAGKTTTIKMCMDLIRPSTGSIALFGRDPRDPAVKHRVGYLPEHPYFYDYLKPQEILDYFGRLFGLDRRTRKRRIAVLLDRVGLTHAKNRALRKFSKGMLQRLGVAQALINEPDLLVFDEPLSGLDPMGRKDIRDIIIEERAKGTTVFFSSHILSDIEHLCDRVAIIVNGLVQREGLLSELLLSELRQSEVHARNLPASVCSEIAGDGRVVDLGSVVRMTIGSERVGDVISKVIARGGIIELVEPHRDSLEDLFVRVAEAGS